MVDLKHGDCLELMKDIPDGSVDMVLTDPPYGTMDTDGGRKIGIHGWDKQLPSIQMFTEFSRILRPNGKAVIFSQGEYTCHLMTNGIPSLPFSYRAIWEKNSFGNCLGVNKNMVGFFEDICVFSKIAPKHDFCGENPLRSYFANVLQYMGFSSCRQVNNALGHRRAEHSFYVTGNNLGSTQFSLCTEKTYVEIIEKFHIDRMEGFREYAELRKIQDDFQARHIEEMNRKNPSIFNLWEGNRFKSNVLKYAKDNDSFHPTQKPVALLEDLIKTYTNGGDTILDNCMGSGSTGVACVNTGRRFIGMELDPGYFEIAQKRIAAAENQRSITE